MTNNLEIDRLLRCPFCDSKSDAVPLVDKSADMHRHPVDEIAETHGEVVDAEFPGKPTIAECIAQLDIWNGYLEGAIDRQALEQLGQHANDEPFIVGRDPMEQLP